MGSKKHIAVAVGLENVQKFVALVEIDGDKACTADILVKVKRGTLDNAVFGDHGQIQIFVGQRFKRHIGSDLFVGRKLDNVDKVCTL